MAGPMLIDTHMHIYKTREEGFAEKAGGYVVWEYGEKPDLRMSHFGGNLEDALEAIEDGGFSRAVVTNLFKAGRSGGPETDLAERLMEFNRWACDLAAPYPQLVPFVAADPTALPGSEGAAHLRDMVENHGARGIKLHPIVQEFFMGTGACGPYTRPARSWASRSSPIQARPGVRINTQSLALSPRSSRRSPG